MIRPQQNPPAGVLDRPREVTQLLNAAAREPDALNRLVGVLYDELRRLAQQHLRRERADHTLQATALVHEAYMRLVDEGHRTWENRLHFFASAASAIRRILIEHARRKTAQKRGGGRSRTLLDDALIEVDIEESRLLDVEAALSRLSEFDARKGRLVELRFFAGLTNDEIATLLDVSPSTIAREWRAARAWLASDLQGWNP